MLVAPFEVKYGPIPFTITEIYDPVNASEPGWYTKHVNVPGGKLLKFATVIVDATMSPDGSQYSTLTTFGCVSLLGVPVYELVFATRQKTPPAIVLRTMEATARKLGVMWKPSDLKVVNQTLCKN